MQINKNLKNAIGAALAAGDAIMQVYDTDFAVELKSDESPLTEADTVSNDIIVDFLGNELPILSEENENVPYLERNTWNRFWLVDPLDGTKEFMKKNGEFTVNIALIENGLPVLGVVYAPALNALYMGAEGMTSAFMNVDKCKDPGEIIQNSVRLSINRLPEMFTVVASRSHMSVETENIISAYELQYGMIDLLSVGSSLKLCMVAARKAHVYPRLGPTMEWDTAAAHAVAKYSGCRVLNYDTKQELTYNKENLLNPYFVVSH